MILHLSHLFYALFLFVTLLAFTIPVHATENRAPIPVHRDDAFKGLQIDIEKQKQLAEDLKAKEEQGKQELKKLEHNIIPVAEEIQSVEKELLSIEDRITTNLLKQTQLKKLLQQNQKILSDSLIAAVRLKRLPTETLFLQASSPLQTAQTAMILERTVPQLKDRMDNLSAHYKELAALQKSLDQEKEQQKTELANLEIKQKEIKKLISQRQRYIVVTQKNIDQAEKKAQQFSKEAKNLKDLVEKVREKNKKAAQKAIQKKPAPPVISEKNQHNWPVAGIVTVQYGSKDTLGAKVQGIKIKTRPSALVTAPMSGTVRFAGPFKRYGQLVILEHAGGWHSLISGLNNLDVVAGQSIKNGEPIGSMSSENHSEGLLLYYELRYKGNPVNPSKKLKGLS